MGRPEPFLGVAAAERIRAEIARAGGNEVCFVARVEHDGEVVEAQVVARGNSTAVLAAGRGLAPGHLLVHNHPSGDLTPSHPDLEVAERLWAEGLGFAITDNLAGSLYVVVRPPPERRTQPLDPRVLEADLGPGGALASAHPRYEDRPDQRAMTALLARLYEAGGIGLVEAGTGIGKSVAYLLPAIRWAVLNGERTVVSTNTIHLQEQLVGKDLPLLQRALGISFRFALVKGRNNYVSIRRAKLAALSGTQLFEDRRQEELRAIVEWVERTQDGSLSDLSFRPSPEVWDEVASESDVCLRTKCPHFESCFYQRSRREAAGADVLVVNHHLLFSDLAVRRAAGNYSAAAVLPHYRRLILDEAHNLEETATRHLGATVSRRGYNRLLRRLEHRGKGVLPALERAIISGPRDLLSQACLDLIHQRLRPELEGAWKRGGAVFGWLESITRQQGGTLRFDHSSWGRSTWPQTFAEDFGALVAHLDTLVRGLQLLRERVLADETAAAALEERLLEVRGVSNRIEGALLALRSAIEPEGDTLELVRWAEVRAAPRSGPSGAEERESNVLLAAAPLELGELLRESLWERLDTSVLTSATLTTGEDFSFVRGRLGLGGDLPVHEAVHPSPFDFPSQALLVVPGDLPLPAGADDERHGEATRKVVEEMAEIADGGLFVLLTSYRALSALAASLRRRGVERRWPLFVHGEAPRAQLVERFITAHRGILLGTDSFWEGVDVPGDPLRAIVIPKLPFRVPTEPITAARIEALEARGINAFSAYMLPHAAIRLKQGFGRLIRSRNDRGAVAILDGRVHSRSYGRYLLRSLPDARVVEGAWDECRRELEGFYGTQQVPAGDDGLPVTGYRLPAPAD